MGRNLLRRWILPGLMLCIVPAVVAVLVLFFRRTFQGAEYVLTIQEGEATSGTIRVEVIDKSGAPLRSIPVASDSDSGWTEDVVTDQAGVATIIPGEPDVQAIRIGKEELRLVPELFPFGTLFAPSSGRGLLVVARRRV